MITRIHVNGQNLRKNKVHLRKGGRRVRNTVFTAKDYRTNRTGTRVVVHGPSTLVYRPRNPLNSGAVAWIETSHKVDVYHGGRKVQR